MYDINIVIVNYKMKDDINKCLSSLFADFADDKLNVHVVVVDNASGDGIEPWLRVAYPEVQCLQLQKNLGFGAAQNAGIKSASAKYQFVLNPDTYFFPGSHTLKKLYLWMETHPKIGMIGPKMLYPDGALQYSCYRFPTFWQPLFSRTKFGTAGQGKKINDYALMKDYDHNRTQPVDWLMGSAMFVRAALLDKVGLFDENFFMYYEDSDWCRRFWEHGFPVYYVHDIVIQHVHGRGSAKIPGVLNAVIKNKLARVHIISWLKYMWKWRGNYRFYAQKIS